VVVLAVGTAATVGTGLPLVALLAPAVAGAGIAYAYGPGIDPAWELSCSMAVNDRMVLLVRAVAVFFVNAALGLAASAASGLAASVTFGWLVPMTAVSALALAAATVARSANVGVAAGMAGWAITVLAAQASSGQWSAAITDWALVAPYLIFAAGCAAVVILVTRVPRGAS
jgi:ascorbate-specific PTS system EIIC-type component UlaA